MKLDQKERLTHLNDSGYAKMVGVGHKTVTERLAKAQALVTMKPATFEHLNQGDNKKGDVLAIAQVAGIMAAKKTSDLIPLCHPLMLSAVDLTYTLIPEKSSLLITSVVKTSGQTGVEMEALTAVSVCALTIYDMLKAVDPGMVIGEICLIEKRGGKSGHYQRGV